LLKRCQHQMQSQNLSFQQLSSTIGGARLHAFCGKPKPCILFFENFRVSLRSGNLLHGIITELRRKRIFIVLVLYFLSLPLTGFNAFVHLSTILSRRSKINLIRSVCTTLLKKDKNKQKTYTVKLFHSCQWNRVANLVHRTQHGEQQERQENAREHASGPRSGKSLSSTSRSSAFQTTAALYSEQMNSAAAAAPVAALIRLRLSLLL
jgi:hypothetical protein